MAQSHQLAAFMFTDIAGYTTLMGEDSAKALELVRISKEIQKPLVEKLLIAIQDGLEASRERFERMKLGTTTTKDYEKREI